MEHSQAVVGKYHHYYMLHHVNGGNACRDIVVRFRVYGRADINVRSSTIRVRTSCQLCQACHLCHLLTCVLTSCQVEGVDDVVDVSRLFGVAESIGQSQLGSVLKTETS